MLGRRIGLVTLSTGVAVTGWQSIETADYPHASGLCIASTHASLPRTVTLQVSPDGSTASVATFLTSTGGTVTASAGKSVAVDNVPYGKVRLSTTAATTATLSFHLWIR